MKAGYRWVIPGAELRPLILEWAKQNEYDLRPSYKAHRGGSSGAAPRVTLYEALSHRSGVSKRQIGGIVNDTLPKSRGCGGSNISFDTADKLLCAMDMVNEWHDRLASYYEEPIEVGTAEARRLNAKENMKRDIRDPKIVGERLLGIREHNPDLPIEVIADMDGLPAPDWTGDGFMSANPAEHHSGTSQLGNERIKAQS